MQIMPFVVSWAVLATVVIGLAFYRKIVARKEDDYLHFEDGVSTRQEAMARKLEAIDKWGKLLTILAAVYSLVVLGVVLYNGWISGGGPSPE